MRYRFGPFELDAGKGVLLRDGSEVRLTAKALELLLALVRHYPEALSKSDLILRVWNDPNASENTFYVTMSAVRKALKEHHELIVRTSAGYRFAGEVREANAGAHENGIRLKGGAETAGACGWARSRFFGSRVDALCVFLACGIYAAHYVVALFLEVAYRWDAYSKKALVISPVLFCWIFATSVLALGVVAKTAVRQRAFGWLPSVSILLFAAFVVFVLGFWVLPSTAVTEATFQTYPATSAYLKDTIYILPVAVRYLAVPFHFVNAMRQELNVGNWEVVWDTLLSRRVVVAPSGTIYIRMWVLGALLVGMAVYSLLGRAHLFDNLLPGPYLS